MLAAIGSSNVFLVDSARTNEPAAQKRSPEIATLPDPKTQLEQMINGEDIGAAITAMIMQSSTERRESSRACRDAAYDAQEAAQREELKHMRDAADGRLAAGLLEGGFKLASAGASFASVVPSAKADAIDNTIEYGGMPTGGKPALAALIARKAELQQTGNRWSAVSGGLEATAVATPAIAKFFSDRDEEAGKEASMRSEKLKRTAEGHADDVKVADESLEKCLDFLRDWLNAKDAARSAAAQRT